MSMLITSETPRFRNQMRIKCELSFAECSNQPDVRNSKRGPESKALKTYTTSALVLYWKILLGEQIHNWSKAFLFNKLIYISPSNASAPCIHPPFLISAWLTTILSPVSALFCRKMLQKVSRPVKTVHYQMKKGRAWRRTFWRVFKARRFKGFH